MFNELLNKNGIVKMTQQTIIITSTISRVSEIP